MALNHQTVLDSPLNVAMREGNYASTACSSSTNQETVQRLTLSPKIPTQSKDSWHYPNGPTNLDEELDALLGTIEFDFAGEIECEDSHSGEPAVKRRKIAGQGEEDEYSEEIFRALLFPDENPLPTKVRKSLSPQNSLTCLRDDIDANFHLQNHNDVTPLTEISCHSLEHLDDVETHLDTCSTDGVDASETFARPSSCIISLRSSPEPTSSHPSAADLSPNGQDLLITPDKRIDQCQAGNQSLSSVEFQEAPGILFESGTAINRDTYKANNQECAHDKDLASESQKNTCSTANGLGQDCPRVENSNPAQSPKICNPTASPQSKNEAASLKFSWDTQQKSLYEEFMSSFPVLCSLELAGSASPYQIPRPYRQVLDELTKQWSEGTAKNEFRKALIAYVKEKLEIKISQDNAAILLPKINCFQDSSELSDLLVREESSGSDLIAEWIDEVRVMKECSKKLLRDTFTRGRQSMAQLREIQSRLQAENAQLRAELVKFSDQAHSDPRMRSDGRVSVEANDDFYHGKLLSSPQGLVIPSPNCATEQV